MGSFVRDILTQKEGTNINTNVYPTISHRAPPGFQFWHCTLKDSSRMHFCITVGFYNKEVCMEIFSTMVKVSVNSSDIFSGCSIVCGKQMETPSIIQVAPVPLLFCCCDKVLCPRQRREEIADVSLQAIAHLWGKLWQKPKRGLKKKPEGSYLSAFYPGFLCYLSYWDSLRSHCLDCLHLTIDANWQISFASLQSVLQGPLRVCSGMLHCSAG